MRMPSHMRGVTLIELMIVVVITAVLLAIAVPAFQDTIDRNRLKAASQNLFADLQFAKEEAIKRNAQVFLVMSATSGGAVWSYFLTENAACDQTETNTKDADFCGTGDLTNGRVKRSVSDDDYPGIKMTGTPASNQISFSPLRGTADNGTVVMQSPRQKELQVIVSIMGRIRMCSPSGSSNVAGYASC